MIYDQAADLRKKLQSTPNKMERLTRVITITSGKGGVGKSNFTLNFALALLEKQHKTVILDADIGLANIDILMGIAPKYTLQDMLYQHLQIWDILEKGPNELEFIAGGSDLEGLFDMNKKYFPYLFEQFLLLNGYVDTLLIDTGAGVTPESLKFMFSSDEIFLVTSPEPTSITDAYAMIKMIFSKKKEIKISLVINRVTNEQEGHNTANRIKAVAKRFLNCDIGLLGFIYDDEIVPKAVKKQEPFYLSYPNSRASRSINNLVKNYLSNHEYVHSKGVRTFLERMTYWFHR
ncbi:MAG: MinD/ParA family protein [Tepidibacillus sp.]